MTSQEEKINWWKRLNTPYYTPLGTGGLMLWVAVDWWKGWYWLIGTIIMLVIFMWSIWRGDIIGRSNE